MKMLHQFLTFLFLLFFGFTQSTLAQCGTFDESSKGEEGLIAHSLYRDAVKANDMDGAYENWKKAYTIAPAANGKNHLHYADGRKILKNKFEKATDEAVKQDLVNQILKLYDEQIQCYGDAYKEGQDAHLLGRKGYNMFYYFKNYIGKNSDKTIQDILAATVEKGGNEIEDIILVPYASVVVNGFAAERLTKEDARAVHARLNEIADHHINNKTKKAKRFSAAKESMNGTFATIEGHIFDCEYFVEKVRPIYEDSPEDPEVIEESIRELKRRGCEAGVPLLDELETKWSKYAAEINAQRVAEFQANNPAVMAKRLKDEGDYDGAVAKYEEAIEKSATPEEQAPYYLRIAEIRYSKQGRLSEARSLAKKAAGMKDGFGSAYIMLGDIYTRMAKTCKDDWDTRMGILAALDQYYLAKSKDATVADTASKRIGRLSDSKPEKQDGFMRGVSAGQTVSCGCGIGESVQVSFK